jgi:hypothetical protein
MSGALRNEAISLYRSMLRSGGRCTDYNYRNFILRRVKEGFRAGQGSADNASDLVNDAQSQYEQIERIVTVQNLFAVDQSVMNHVRR